MATTTNRYLSYPAAANGITATSGSVIAYTFGSWTQLVPASTITSTFYIAGFTWGWVSAATTVTTFEFIFEIGTGAAASEVTIIQLPSSLRNQSNVGYLPSNFITLPEPVQVAANTRIAVRLANSSISIVALPAIKILYQIV